MIDTFLSNKIRIVSFLLIVMVVYIHSSYLESADYELNNFVQLFLSQGIFRMAVPLFYAISGYLYFHNVGDSIKPIFVKMKKRIRTLLIPYVIANMVFVLIYLVLYFIPQVEGFVNSKIINELMNSDIITAFSMLFIGPIGFHLWFLRDLMLVVLFTPLLYFLLKYIPGITLFMVFLICLFIQSITGLFYALNWFTLGAYLAVRNINILFQKTTTIKCLMIFCLLYYIGDSICIGCNINLPFAAHYLGITLGVLGFWILYDFLYFKSNNRFLLNLEATKYTFFIYLFHEPALNVFKKILPVILGKSQLSYLVSYFIAPWIMVIVAIYIAKLLNKITPGMYALMVGRR